MEMFKTFIITLLSLLLISCVQGVMGGIDCGDLEKEKCAFAVSSTGKRCVLEKHIEREGMEIHTCEESEIGAEGLRDWVETDACIEACGLHRNTFGVSSDLLLEQHFIHKLCSSKCYYNCPNIVDLFFNLAAGEGSFLPNMCQSGTKKVRRAMSELKSSGEVAPGPSSMLISLASAPTQSFERIAP